MLCNDVAPLVEMYQGKHIPVVMSVIILNSNWPQSVCAIGQKSQTGSVKFSAWL